MEGKLYKSSTDKVIDGVCGGIADYFDIDSSIVRLVWAITVFIGGTGVFLYIIAAIIFPRDVEVNGYTNHESNEYVEGEVTRKKTHNNNSRKTLGLILIVVGIFLFLRRFFYIFDLKFFWPFVLVALGIFLIFRGKRD